MNYNQLIQSAQQLRFIEDEKMADAAIKATFGILVSAIPEENAREITRTLPDPLTFEKLRSHQQNINDVSPEEHVKQICTQFNVNENQAQELVQNVFATARQNMSEEDRRNWEQRLPQDWSSFIAKFNR